MNITNFLNEQYSDSALYMNYRSCPSYIDGQKNAARKVVYTVRKTNLKTQEKVSALASEIVKEAAYLHGDASGQGTIVTMAQSYCGSNNLPVLEGVGAFGTRFTTESAAPRYIFAKPSKYFDSLFRKEDDCNLISQEFEGGPIEPVFYVPTLPLLLVNGSTGIGVGFAPKILPRSLKNIIKLIKDVLNDKEMDSKLLVPCWNGFTGSVKSLGNNKWEIRGHIVSIVKRTVTIDELPISYDLLGYINFLKKLKEKGIIEKYVDYSEDDKFKFEVTMTYIPADEEQAMNTLGLVETITESLVTIDEHNSIREFDTVEELFDAYYYIKKEYLRKRLASEIKKLESEEKLLKEIFTFITSVIKGEINLKLKKAEVEKQLKGKGFENTDKLLGMPLYSVTEDKAKEIEKKWKDKIAELEAMKKQTPTTLWMKDLDELEKNI